MSYPIPPDEHRRMQAVLKLNILDTPPDPSFDSLVRLAAELFGTKISLVSIIDADRQWFRAAVGVDRSETPRELAFCAHTVLGQEVFVVEDVASDQRFASHPWVTGEPHIRFYAGVPLMIEPGLAAGTLCVIDDKPRRLSQHALQTLVRLAEIATALLVSHRNALCVLSIAEELQLKNVETERQAAQIAVQARALEAGSLLANMGAWELDLRTGLYSWSDSMYRLHGVERSYPLTHASLEAFYEPAERERLKTVVRHSLATNSDYMFEGEMVTPDGKRKFVRLSGSVEFADGMPIRRFGWKQDITEEFEAKRRLVALAEQDPLTGLLNRNRFKEIIHEHLAGDQPISVLLMDLDGFKDINDSYGHAAGDAFLLEVAHRLKRVPVGSCSAARLGGDEFAVCIRHNDTTEAEIAAEWLLHEIRRPWLWQQRTFELTTSIGIVGPDECESTPEDLLQFADLALYAAKRSGRNSYCMFSQALLSAANRRVDTMHAFREAFRQDQIVLHFQPKLDLGTGEVKGLEALIRWQKPDGQIIGPALFADAFNEPSLADQIGDHVLRSALRSARRWHEAGLEFGNVAVNLSAFQFRNPNLASGIIEQLAQANVPFNCLEVEITEEVLLARDSDAVRATVEALHQAGVRIAFDDFGTGFASLTHLSEFPVDIIKVDRSFVNGIEALPKRRAITASIINLARTLDIEIVAEGIETTAQRDLLRAMGCRIGQGYLLGRPADHETTTVWLAKQNLRQPLKHVTAPELSRQPSNNCFG